MKTYRLIEIALIAILFSANFAACSDDYDSLSGRVDDLEDRVSKLEELCKQMNTNISSLKTVVEAFEDNDGVTNITPIIKDGKEIGYTITFKKNQPITIYHGKDGKDGSNGKDGVNGTNGEDGKDGENGITPAIGVSKDSDGIYYWTLNGEWLLDSNGSKIKAAGVDGNDGSDGVNGENGTNGTNGIDGITPQLKIKDDYWFVSYDKGITWTKLGKSTATTESECIFQDVKIEDNTITLTLADNTAFTLLRYKPIQITFDMDEEEQGISAGGTVRIPYTLVGATDHTIVSASSDGNYKVKLENQTVNGGVITVTAPDNYADGFINVLVSDNNGFFSLHTIHFYEWRMTISSSVDESLVYFIPTDGGNVTIPLDMVNFNYKIVIPEDAKDWVNATVNTRGAERKENIIIYIAANMTNAVRSCIVNLLPSNGTKAIAQFRIIQRSQAPTQLEKVFTGKRIKTLDDTKYFYSCGFLTNLKDRDGKATFFYNYSVKDNEANNIPNVVVRYKRTSENAPQDYILKVWVNSQGFASRIHQTNFNDEISFSSTKTCQYDSEGYLTFMKDGRENREYTITWENDNITHIQTKRFIDEGTDLEWTKEFDFDYYTDANSNNMLLYYRIYDVDIDEVDCLYWAGLLGKAPKNLTKSLNGMVTGEAYSDSVKYEYTWTENSVNDISFKLMK